MTTAKHCGPVPGSGVIGTGQHLTTKTPKAHQLLTSMQAARRTAVRYAHILEFPALEVALKARFVLNALPMNIERRLHRRMLLASKLRSYKSRRAAMELNIDCRMR